MKSNINAKAVFNSSIFKVTLGTAFILLIPLVAMQFSSEVNWGVEDFIVIGALLFGAGMLLALITNKVSNKNYWLLMAVALIVVVVYVWAELAVGIFTNLGS